MKKSAIILLAAGLTLTAVLLRVGASRPMPIGGPYTKSELQQLDAEQSFVEEAAGQGLHMLIRAENFESAELFRNGRFVQAVTFRAGEAAAGPLAPDTYTLTASGASCKFTLAENASVQEVSGDGWTDGEVLYFGPEG